MLYLHKFMTMQRASILHYSLKTLGERREVITGHYLCSVPFDQRQTNSEQDLRTLVEEAVPYP